MLLFAHIFWLLRTATPVQANMWFAHSPKDLAVLLVCMAPKVFPVDRNLYSFDGKHSHAGQ